MCITKKDTHAIRLPTMPINYNLCDNLLPVSAADASEEEEDSETKSFKEFEKRHQMTKASMKAWGICKGDRKGRLFPNISLDDNAFDKVFQDWVASKNKPN